MFYFAYGSNLHPMRLEERVGVVRCLGIARLRGVRLSFDKVGDDGSGKCNIPVSRDLSSSALGAVFEMSLGQAETLDSFESIGRGYTRVDVRVNAAKEEFNCFSYRAMASYRDEAVLPFDWYRELVYLGSVFHGFPEDYSLRLAARATKPDPDSERSASRWARCAKMRSSR